MFSFTCPETDLTPYSRGFLDLDCASKIYPYQGIEQFWKIWDEGKRNLQDGTQNSEWVLFFDVAEDMFNCDFLNSPDKIILKSWNSYDAIRHLLLAKMPISPEHEAAKIRFEDVMSRKLRSIGIYEAVHITGSATRHGDNGSKQPDCQYSPIRRPRDRPKGWPTVVLEIAVSETPKKLTSDVRWWLSQLNGATKAVLNLKVDREVPKITFEKWTRDGNERPKRERAVTVWKGARGNISIDNGPLVIGFEEILLRSPTMPRETDVIFGDQELQEIATSIWLEQEF